MANSLASDVLAEHELRQYIQTEGAQYGTRFVAMLKSAQDSGELSKEFDPVVIVQIIGTFVQGMSRLSLVNYDRKRLEKQVEVLLTALGI